MASLSGHLSDSSSSKLAVGSTRRRPPAASPSRRLRFEDETETEAESRYLERQRRRVGHRGTGVLLSKPDLNLYVNGRAGMKGVRPVVERQQTELMPAGRVDQCDSCGTVLGGEINLNLRLQPRIPEDWGRSLYKPSLNLWTEPIRETYIGSITAGETSGGGGGDRCVMNNQVRKRTNQVERNENQVTPPQATPNTDLPINPYAPNQLTTPTQPSDLIPPISKCPSFLSPPVTSAMMSQIRLNGTKAGKNLNQNQEESHRELRSRAELKERSPCVVERSLDLRTKNSSSSLRTSDLTAECQAPPTPDSSSDGQIIQPMTAELHSDDASLPKHFRRNQSSRLSLRHLFSTVRLSRSRTSSLDRLSSRPDSSASDPSESDPDLLCRRKSSGLLKKTLSVQSLSVQGSPFLQLRKSPSVQIFVSEQKKKKDRSADYRPAAEQ
ncbi:uncharacterized protein si:dkey-121a11.3 [Morone saxatilis]|uniref:uncharacterized protein si:dkey-121a11.3 n=1 Tax=Morone saxatilis TaxID=34816 RepID=UPI0015E215E9|nr:uncharacterized protein si:dkey-121a11.3 [Morone saxatilis]